MKILYGVNSFGNGHITRSRVMAKELKKAGHDVTYLFSGRKPEKFFDMEEFGDSVIYKKGLQFYIEDGKVNLYKTIKNNDLLQVIKDVYSLNVNYDLIITDYEPITAWAAKIKQKQSIGIGHQYAFTKNIPISHANKFMLYMMNKFAPVDIELGLHWDSFNQNILPPIIDVNYFDPDIKIDPNKILVYLPFENLSKLLELFSQFDTKFVIYTQNRNFKEGNLEIKSFSKNGFLYDLQSSSGVICNAGFELASETLHLNKKLLVKPVFGQMEQHSNALAMQILNYGLTTNKLTYPIIEQFIIHEQGNKPKWSNTAEQIVNWLADISVPLNYNKFWSNNEGSL